MTNKIYRNISNEIAVNKESRHIVGYAAVFECESVDLGFIETIKRGAITQELVDSCDIFCRFDHNPDKVLARSNKGVGSLTLTVDEKGLKYEFDAPLTALGDEVLEYLKRGDIKQSSFCFSMSGEEGTEKWEKRNGKIYRSIYQIDKIYDTAIVWQPAYPDTSCDKRSYENALKRFENDEKEKPNDEKSLFLYKDKNTNNDIMKEDEKDELERNEEELENQEEMENKEEIEDPDKENEEREEEPEKEEEERECDEEEKRHRGNFKNFNKRNKNKNSIKMEFKLLKAINDIANNRSLDSVASAVNNAGIKEMRKSGVNGSGQIQIPVNEMRAAITVAAEGTDVVATNIYDILEPLRAKNVLIQAGASFLTNLVGDVQVPVMSGSNVTWEGETTAASDGAGAFTSVKLQPKRLTAYIDISKQFLLQDSVSAEMKIRQDLINAINSKLEATILGESAGTSTQPAGIFVKKKDTENKDVAWPNIASFKNICDLEATIDDANVVNPCVYVISNKAKAVLRNMAKSSKVTQLVMENGQIDGTDAYNTSNVAGYGVAYGDFSQIAIGQWGAIDLTVDPYTKAGEGKVRLVVNAYFDAKVLRPEAIALADATPAS